MKRARGPTTGLFQRKTDSDEIDLEAISGNDYTCGSSKCKLGCCDRLAKMSLPDRAKVILNAQSAVRNEYFNGPTKGAKGRADCVLRGRMHASVKLAPTSNPFRHGRKKIPGAVKGGCQWCNTVPGDFDRRHRCNVKKCPRWIDSQRWLDKYATKQVRYILPALVDDENPIQVSRSKFAKVYMVGRDRLKSLASARTEVVPPTSQTGTHNNRKKLSEDDEKGLLAVMTLNLALAQDHYVKFDDLNKTQSFAQNVTHASLWMEFCEKHD